MVVPAEARSPIDTVLVLDLDGSAEEIPPSALGGGTSLASGKPARASNVFMKLEEFGPAQALDDDDSTRWATDQGTRTAWLDVDLGGVQEIGAVAIEEAYAGRIRRYAIRHRNRADDPWLTSLEGQTVGGGDPKTFAPVKARWVRLEVVEASEGPTIQEFRVLPPVR